MSVERKDVERIENFTESVHNRVLMKHVRIIGIPLSLKKNFKVLLRELLEESEYSETDKEVALTWPSMIGSHGSTFGVRVKMSFKFWNWYKIQGSSNLGKYSRRNGCTIRLMQENGLIRNYRENLCLYIRNEIRRRYQAQGKKTVDLKLKKDHLIIRELRMYDSVILVERFNVDMSKWKGLSMDKLMDPRLLEGKKV